MRIDQLEEENARLKARLRYQERTAQEGPFGSSTPSAKIPIKPNAPPENARRQGGAKPGHGGHGRHRFAEPEITGREFIAGPEQCPHCGGSLDPRGSKFRTIIEVEPVKKKVIRYQLRQCDCPHCHRTFTAQAPGVFPKALLSNRLLAHVAVEHYLEGATLGRLSRQLGLGEGSLWAALHQLAQRLESVPGRLLLEYRRAPVKHADETSWRTDGNNGYAWLFCTRTLSLFRFRQSRSGQVAREVLGLERLRGTLVVDRYAGYNQSPCAIQYCYCHLLREVQDLEKEFPQVEEVLIFVARFAPLLAGAIKLRAQGLNQADFAQQAFELKLEIKSLVYGPARHPGIQRIQNIFRENSRKLYHWAKKPEIPAENNYAERELRPLVIARKISFGSQSLKGARTRETLMSVLHTLRKRAGNTFEKFNQALDAMAQNARADPYSLLFNTS